MIDAILRVKTIDPLDSLIIRNEHAEMIQQVSGLQGEFETDVRLPIHDGLIHLELAAKTGAKETAIFVTLMPDGMEERTAHAIGALEFTETMDFHWEHE